MTSTTHPTAAAWRQQLRRQAEHILRAIANMAVPKTFVEANRAMRAVMTADKMIAQLCGEPSRRTAPATAPKATAPQATDADMPGVSELEEAIEAFMPEPRAMNRQQRRFMERLAKKRGQTPPPSA